MATIMTLANIITLTGMGCVGLYMIGYTTGNMFLLIGGFSLAVISDFADGRVARARNEVTALGKILDPVRDRMLLVAFFGNLVAWKMVGTSEFIWIVLLAVPEILIGAGRFLANKAIGKYVSTNSLGKFRQVVHVGFMAAVFSEHYSPVWFPSPSLLAALRVMAGASWLAFFAYFADGLRAWKRARSPAH
ncbi:MAG: CDP-alcohol phosphatidyltransferase family protein [Candidatus Jorgensenbacteria bacterium]